MTHGLHGSLERPIDGTEVTEITPVDGWAFAENGERLQVEVYCDDILIYQTDSLMPRYEVDQRFPVFESAYQSGFHGNITLFDFEDGDHVLRALAKTADGREVLIGTPTIYLRKKIKKAPAHLKGKRKTMTQGFGSGEKIVERMVELCDIEPTESVLEVGSHFGRLAVPFTRFLHPMGTFNGLEINPAGGRVLPA